MEGVVGFHFQVEAGAAVGGMAVDDAEPALAPLIVLSAEEPAQGGEFRMSTQGNLAESLRVPLLAVEPFARAQTPVVEEVQ